MSDLNTLCRQYAELIEDKKKARARVEAIQEDIRKLMNPILEGFAALAADPETSGKAKITVPTAYGARTVSPRIKYSTACLIDRVEAAKILEDTGLGALVGLNYNAQQLNAYVGEQMRQDDAWEPPVEWQDKIRITEYQDLSITKS